LAEFAAKLKAKWAIPQAGRDGEIAAIVPPLDLGDHFVE